MLCRTEIIPEKLQCKYNFIAYKCFFFDPLYLFTVIFGLVMFKSLDVQNL